MQVLTVLVFTMFALSLLSQAVKASPVPKDDYERKEDHRALAVEKNKEFKRICGMSLICDPFYSVKRNLHVSIFIQVSFIPSIFEYARPLISLVSLVIQTFSFLLVEYFVHLYHFNK